MSTLNNTPTSADFNHHVMGEAPSVDSTPKEATVHKKDVDVLPHNLIGLIRSGDGISLQPIAFVEVRYPEEDLMFSSRIYTAFGKEFL